MGMAICRRRRLEARIILKKQSLSRDDPCTATTTHFEFPTLQKATEKEERLAAEQVVVNTPR